MVVGLIKSENENYFSSEIKLTIYKIVFFNFNFFDKERIWKLDLTHNITPTNTTVPDDDNNRFRVEGFSPFEEIMPYLLLLGGSYLIFGILINI